MSDSIESYIIKKKSWPRFGRLTLLWDSLEGRRLVYLGSILALACEAFFTFVSPVIVKLTIDSILGTQEPIIPFFLKPIAHWLFGPELNGGGIIDLSAALAGTGQNLSASSATEWVWRPWLRSNLWTIGLAFLFCIVFQSLFSFLASYGSNAAAEHAAKKMRDRLYAHVQDLPYEALLRAQSGDWLQRCTSDVDTTRRFLCYEFMEICRTLFLVGIAYPVMYSLSSRLTFWGCLVVPLILAYSFVFHKIVEKIFLVADEREGVLSGIIQENVTGVRVVRAFARQKYELDHFGVANDRFRDQVFKLIIGLGLFWGVSSFLGLLQISIVLGEGLFLMAAGSCTLGLLVLFLTYEQQTLWPIRQFGRILADTGKTRVALGRMAELLALQKETELNRITLDNDSPNIARLLRGGIDFDHVGFTYPDGTRVLKDISFHMAPGERLAVVGPTGSGKSTLVHLLLRLYEPTEGRILIGGRDIRTISKRCLRRQIALVLQEGFLYGKTIRENIRMGKKEATEEALLLASQRAALHHVVEGFSDGYNTMVGERGVTLSGGQRQRLALARALVRGAPLMILDDSLSAVDTETDRKIREAITRSADENPETQNGTCQPGIIIIAHRLTTLASADRILVLEEGCITALGTHTELTTKPGLYRRLAELQKAVC